MRKIITIVLSCVLTSVYGQNIDYANTIKIEPDDSKEVIIEKAAHVVPTENQLRAMDREFIAFVHFGPNTFTRMEWGTGKENPAVFELKNLDTDQWCEAIRAAGMKLVILTVKHHDGFVLWQSRYTKHGIMSSPFQNGKGDILRSLSESCRKYGLRLGVYLSPADLYQIESPDGLYGNLSKYTMRTIPKPVEGRPFKNKKTFRFMADDYNEYFMSQLFEILTEYGPIDEVWFDGAHPKRKGGQRYNYTAWRELIRTIAPKAVIFGREDVRWCGNEAGRTRDTEWNVVPFQHNPDTMTHYDDIVAGDVGSRERLYEAGYLHYQYPETDTSIREGWFYRDDSTQKVRNADDVFDIYERSVGGNAVFLLNIPPNRDGRFSDTDVEVLREVGRRIHETYDADLLHGASGPHNVLDDNSDTYVSVDENSEIVITTPHPITFNRLVIQEAIAKRGERVEEHVLEAWIDGGWKELARATNIGHKRILRFADVTTDSLRLRFPKMRKEAGIAKVSAHYYHSRPPQLTAHRRLDGTVEIKPVDLGFGWNCHGQNVAANLNAGFKIYYTLNGDDPAEKGIEYKGPIQTTNQELRAVSVLNGRTGAVYREQLGYVKSGWTVLTCGSEQDGHEASKAIDENPDTYWLSEKDAADRSIAVDIGRELTLKGFAYTPQKTDREGMMERGMVWISRDGKDWQKAEDFTFGSLINDPMKRYHYFRKPYTARYVKIEQTAAAANSGYASMAELDFF